MDGDGSTIAYLLVVLALLLLAAFCNAAKTAIVAFSDSKLKKLSEEGNPKAKKLQKMLKSPSRLIESCDSLGFLFGFGAQTALIFGFRLGVHPDRTQEAVESPLWCDFLLFSKNATWGVPLVLALVTLLSGFVIYLLGFLLPKCLSERRPEKFAFFSILPLEILRTLFFPFTWLVSALANGVSRLGSNAPVEEQDATEEEIRMMVDVGNEKGVIEESQKDMINNIFEFDDRTVEEVMTHRTAIVAVPQTATIGDIVYLAINEGFSRIPVYEDDIDNIIGVIYVKDLLCLVGCQSTDDFKLSDFIRTVLYVPESNRCRELFKEFTEKKIHLAVVVDEYGGTAGIVTMEDLLEAIVGNIQDEYDDEEIEIQQTEENVYLIDGGADLEEVAEELGLEIGENEDYDTLGGLITDLLGRIPDAGETPTVTYQNIAFTVLEVEDRRIMKAKAVIQPPTEEPEE